jgi:hypothetical protein
VVRLRLIWLYEPQVGVNEVTEEREGEINGVSKQVVASPWIPSACSVGDARIPCGGFPPFLLCSPVRKLDKNKKAVLHVESPDRLVPTSFSWVS